MNKTDMAATPSVFALEGKQKRRQYDEAPEEDVRPLG